MKLSKKQSKSPKELKTNRKKKKIEYEYFIGKLRVPACSFDDTEDILTIDPEALYALAKLYLNLDRNSYGFSIVTHNKIEKLCNDLEILNKEI